MAEQTFSCYFDECDVDRSGVLSVQELKNMLAKKVKISDEALVQMFADIDKDDDQKISKEEFMTALLKPARREAYKQTFQSMDNGSGQLNKDQIFELCEKAGLNDHAEVERMFSEIDKDGSGTIDFNEFMAMV